MAEPREEEYPSLPIPLLPGEVLAARSEDPGFADVLGRARARAKNEAYDPTIHHPNAPRRPNQVVEDEAKLRELCDRWEKLGKPQRHLWAMR